MVVVVEREGVSEAGQSLHYVNILGQDNPNPHHLQTRVDLNMGTLKQLSPHVVRVHDTCSLFLRLSQV